MKMVLTGSYGVALLRGMALFEKIAIRYNLAGGTVSITGGQALTFQVLKASPVCLFLLLPADLDVELSVTSPAPFCQHAAMCFP